MRFVPVALDHQRGLGGRDLALQGVELHRGRASATGRKRQKGSEEKGLVTHAVAFLVVRERWENIGWGARIS